MISNFSRVPGLADIYKYFAFHSCHFAFLFHFWTSHISDLYALLPKAISFCINYEHNISRSWMLTTIFCHSKLKCLWIMKWIMIISYTLYNIVMVLELTKTVFFYYATMEVSLTFLDPNIFLHCRSVFSTMLNAMIYIWYDCLAFNFHLDIKVCQ